MDLMLQFCESRGSALNAAALAAEIHFCLGRYGTAAAALTHLYALFDGETSWGAWLPGFRIARLGEIEERMEAMSAAWEAVEAERNEAHPMRNFIPFVSSVGKSSLGPLFDSRTDLHRHVIEYRPETGSVRVWSRSVESFMEAFLGLALRLAPPLTRDEGLRAHDFSRADIEFLSQWSDVRYPVVEEPRQVHSLYPDAGLRATARELNIIRP